jgi:cyclophilin family peptidyl-prolyl cis-trans isomerase
MNAPPPGATVTSRRLPAVRYNAIGFALMPRTLMLLVLVAGSAAGQARVQSPYSLAEMMGKQAVVQTTLGTFVIQLLPGKAPNHVAHFIRTARDGGYDGTTFFRVVRYGVIQGGDPLTKDPSKAALYGTGGLNELKGEINDEPMTAGAVAAVLAPNKPDSGGSQFFVCVTDQNSLQGQYTVFGRVVDGIEVVQQISAVDADAAGHPKTRVVVSSVTIRDTPPEPFVHDTPAQLAGYRALIETTMGSMTLEFLPDVAPDTVRNFLRLAAAGVYDGITVHRVVPGFVIQTGALAYRDKPLTAAQQKLVHTLAPEFSQTPNVPGLVSMAHGEDPASGSTSFFICTGECHSLDGQYTAFAKVIDGMNVLAAIAAVPVDGETPKTPIVVTRVTIQTR